MCLSVHDVRLLYLCTSPRLLCLHPPTSRHEPRHASKCFLRVLHHATTMLTYPDRQRFEQIRARWETVLAGEEEAAEMVGRRIKQADQQPTSGETPGGSKFRRKLSHGLAFMSLQRKITPGRTQVNVPSLAITAPDTTSSTTATPACDTLCSPPPTEKPPEGPIVLSSEITTHVDSVRPINPTDRNATPQPLPRSRTLSFIPRPVKTESGFFSVGSEAASTSHSLVAVTKPADYMAPSNIPTPSPPLSDRHRVSPRQYLPQHSAPNVNPHNAKPIVTARSLASTIESSPKKAAIRSRTTPNMVKSMNSMQAARRMDLKRPAISPTMPRSVLQENIPTNRQVGQKRSHLQEQILSRDSLAVPGTIHKRRSIGPGTPLGQSKQSSFATPPTARKRLSSHITQQTPVTAKRIHPSEQAKSYTTGSPTVPNDSLTEQSCATQPTHPPTPAPTVIDTAALVSPATNGVKDLQRKTLGTPNGLGGMWRASRALAATNHEVRKLPRSRTFHLFGQQRDIIPPVPPIPEQYKSQSLSNLPEYSDMASYTPSQPCPSKTTPDAPSYESIPEETGEYECSDSVTPYGSMTDRSSFSAPSYSTSSFAVVRPAAPTLGSSASQVSLTTTHSTSRPSSSLRNRPWTISDQHSAEDANNDPCLQVKDYMPPLYWAGRFQSRFDHWRTAAMMAELNPDDDHQATGPLSECKLDQEKLSACHIFNQLRDLCTSNHAADSLWVRTHIYHHMYQLH
jgi:hypothetical protein